MSVLAGGGVSREAIALSIGIARNTLELYYEAELTVGAQLRRNEVLAAMHRAGTKGNVAAARLYLDRAEQAIPQPAKPKAEPKLGKKEIAQAEAAEAPPDWAGVLN